MDYHDDVEEAQEATANSENAPEKNKHDEKLLDIESEPKDILIGLDTITDSSRNGIVHNTDNTEDEKSLEEFFGNLILEKDVGGSTGQSAKKTEETNHLEFKGPEEQKLAMDIFGECNRNFSLANLSSLSMEAQQQQQSLNLLASESVALFDEILNDKQCSTSQASDWEGIESSDTFLPPNILKQSLGDAALGMGQKNNTTANSTDNKVSTICN